MTHKGMTTEEATQIARGIVTMCLRHASPREVLLILSAGAILVLAVAEGQGQTPEDAARMLSDFIIRTVGAHMRVSGHFSEVLRDVMVAATQGIKQ